MVMCGSWRRMWLGRTMSLPFFVFLCQPILSTANYPSDQKLSAEGGTVLREVLAGRQVYVYRSYKDVQIFHFSVPQHVSTALYNFTANDTLACDPRSITVYLQAQSYPVVNPDGAEFPPGLWVNRSQVYEVHLRSDLKPSYLSVPYPVTGDWFMVAFINETSNRITQAGLFPSCHSWLQAEVTYRQENDIVTVVPEIHSHQEIQLYQKVEGSQYYRFYVPSSTWLVFVNISNCVVLEDENMPSCPVNISFRARALPSPNSTDTVIHKCDEEGVGDVCTMQVVPEEETWHYVRLTTPPGTSVQLSMAVKFYLCDDTGGSSYHLLSKLNLNQLCPEERYSTPISSYFNYPSNNTDEISNGTVTTKEQVQSRRILFMPAMNTKQLTEENCWPRHRLVKKTFGGNFVFEYDLPPDENDSVPLLLNITNASPTLLTFNLEPIIDIGGTVSVELAISPFMNISKHNFSVAGCVSLGIREEADVNGECSQGYSLLVNTSSLNDAAALVLIPFPEPGPWFLTLSPGCYLSNASEVVGCSVNVTTVIFGVTSASCLQGKCGRYGSCYQYISGGFIFSTCVCDAGYRGWGCTDSSEATPNWKLLLATLLLTLSNLFFLPAIFLALKRRYFAEAIVYAFTMVFSTFYHACDQEAYNFCLMRLSVMQFCDFYSAIFSFWVTLIAMADLPHSLYSLLHVAGALIVALGVEYDRTGLWVFVVPSASAFVIMASSWVWHCKHQRGCYPSRHYWLTCLLPGVLLAASGLICYAFFETHDNYYYVHSVWHATMALAILCLLPPRREKDERSGGGEEVEPLSGCEARHHITEAQTYSPVP
ncbi:post-GPI attachment to proteins factor 6-like isoform X2 [Homarus americanus]|uniref:post-GPI attachment to proteins factor 6-like isoform X2 n=1 Tax=Homarus americanus TaxID=6706 RepID=UPI001C4878D2|nr:post-GPI attachment to proteins factor 6-like isoform X2 [Homarus americanus]